MLRLLIIFAVLAYLIPGVIVARATWENGLRSLKKEAEQKAKAFSNETKRNNFKRNFIEQGTNDIWLLTFCSLLLWPFFAIGQFINGGERKREKLRNSILEKQAALAQSITVWATEAKKYPTDSITRDTLTMLRAQYEQLEKQLEDLND